MFGQVTDTATSVYYDSATSTQTRGGTGQTTAQLKAPTSYTGIYSGWNVGDTGAGTSNYWDFGTSSDYPRHRLGAFGFDLDSSDVCELSVFRRQQTAPAGRTCWTLSSGGSGHYAVSGAPGWLEAAPTSDGALGAMTAIGFNTTHALTLRPSAAAAQMEPGTYQATLTILNTGSRAREERTVRLTVKPEAAPATGILWQAQITPGESATIPGITGWVEDAYGSINGSEPFLDRGAMFNVQWVSHRGIRSQMRLGLQRSAAAAFDEATLCAGGRSISIPAQEEAATQISLELTDAAIGSTPPWTLGTALTVGIVRAPATCADLAPPGGILWQAEITPAIHSSASFAHITGWSSVGTPYGSINGGRTFTENGATFTVRWVAHNSNTPAMLLRMQRSASVAFDTATLCVGDLSVRISAQAAGTDDINLTIADTVVTGTAPWALGTPLTVGIVRAPTTCADLAQAPPPSADTLSARIISRLEDDGRLYFETGTTVTVRATVTAPANTPYRWAALTRQEEPQQELTLSGATTGSFASRVAGRTISVMQHAPPAGPDFYNLYLLRLTVGDLVVDTKVVVTRAEPEGRAALMSADAGEDGHRRHARDAAGERRPRRREPVDLLEAGRGPAARTGPGLHAGVLRRLPALQPGRAAAQLHRAQPPRRDRAAPRCRGRVRQPGLGHGPHHGRRGAGPRHHPAQAAPEARPEVGAGHHPARAAPRGRAGAGTAEAERAGLVL